jgi:prefoldin subunit 5
MTMPHLMNCAHSEDGWCLDCVWAVWAEHEGQLSSLRQQITAIRQQRNELRLIIESLRPTETQPDPRG